MKCRDFELVVVDLARREPLEASERDSALTHVNECAACAARLRDEQKLSVYLRGTAEATRAANRQASPLVEARLLHAFREHTVVTAAATLRADTALPHVATNLFGGARHWSTSSLSIGAIAATLVLVGLAALLWRLQTSSPQPIEQVRQASHSSISDQQQSPTSTAPPIRAVASVAPPSMKASAAEVIRHTPPSSARAQRQSTKPIINSRVEVARPKPISQLRAGQQAANLIEPEVATEFFPMMPGSSFDGIGSGHVVRVQLPRTALASFGLPINPERAHEPVKADVVLGDDGLARAIRFVR